MALHSDTTFNEIQAAITKHLQERDWLDNDSRSLAISLSLEASELLEHYQWHDKPVGSTHDLGEELADIIIYAFEFAHKNGIDIPAAVRDKLAKAAVKYPAENFKGKSTAEKEAQWLESKLNHKKEGL